MPPLLDVLQNIYHPSKSDGYHKCERGVLTELNKTTDPCKYPFQTWVVEVGSKEENLAN